LRTSTATVETEKENANPTIIDFGSGQNYLGRTLACPPHNKQVVAIEQRHHNVQGARGMDVHAKLAKKEKRLINKKQYKQSLLLNGTHTKPDGTSTPEKEAGGSQVNLPSSRGETRNGTSPPNDIPMNGGSSVAPEIKYGNGPLQTPINSNTKSDSITSKNDTNTHLDSTKGSIQYVEKELSSGDLTSIIRPSSEASTPGSVAPQSSIVVSIHSCGNLTHHGLRSLILNPDVHAVAVVGCCYNLLTERLGPASYKLPSLRSNHPRLEATSSSFDPHGFPMSRRLEDFEFEIQTGDSACHASTVGIENTRQATCSEKGVRLNITARMMAVQAPHNWGPKDSEEC